MLAVHRPGQKREPRTKPKESEIKRTRIEKIGSWFYGTEIPWFFGFVNREPILMPNSTKSSVRKKTTPRSPLVPNDPKSPTPLGSARPPPAPLHSPSRSPLMPSPGAPIAAAQSPAARGRNQCSKLRPGWPRGHQPMVHLLLQTATTLDSPPILTRKATN